MTSHRRLAVLTDVAPAVVYAGVLFYFGLIRLGKLPEVGPVPTDKLLHGLAFGGLALLLMRSLRFFQPAAPYRTLVLFGVAVASLLGALLEVCQSFVAYRSAEFMDWVADTVGALLIVASLSALRSLARRRVHG